MKFETGIIPDNERYDRYKLDFTADRLALQEMRHISMSNNSSYNELTDQYTPLDMIVDLAALHTKEAPYVASGRGLGIDYLLPMRGLLGRLSIEEKERKMACQKARNFMRTLRGLVESFSNLDPRLQLEIRQAAKNEARSEAEQRIANFTQAYRLDDGSTRPYDTLHLKHLIELTTLFDISLSNGDLQLMEAIRQIEMPVVKDFKIPSVVIGALWLMPRSKWEMGSEEYPALQFGTGDEMETETGYRSLEYLLLEAKSNLCNRLVENDDGWQKFNRLLKTEETEIDSGHYLKEPVDRNNPIVYRGDRTYAT